MSQTKAQLIDGKAAEIQFNTGSASTPTIAFTGDTNTGIYSPGADQVAISTNGTGRLFVDASGNLTNTRAIATAYSATNAATWANGLSLYNSSASAPGVSSFINFTGVSNVNSVFGVTQAGSSYGDFVWASFNGSFSERMRLDASGRLGLGTSSPSATTKMSIVDSTSAGIYLLRTAQGETVIENTGPLTIRQSSGNGANQNIFFKTGASVGTEVTAMTIDGSQRVGIGTTSPNTPLCVNGLPPQTGIISAVAASGGRSLALSDNINCSLYVTHLAGGALLGTDSGNAIRFATNGFGSSDEKARIDSSGRLLVGTSSITGIPATLNVIGGNNTVLHTQGANADSPFLFLSHARGTGTQSVNAQDGVGAIAFVGYDGTNALTAARIEAFVDGTPGVNDMPGRLVFSTTADGASSPTERMTIKSDGKIGVGTQSPARVLSIGTPGSAGGQLFFQATDSNSYAGPSNTLAGTSNGDKIIIYSDGASYDGRIGVGSFSDLWFKSQGTSSITSIKFYIGAGGTFEERLRVNNNGVTVYGALAKSSGSFKIAHPLESKKDTHYLYHSFIEGPQADLIYRGHIQLVNGIASVNIDETARMTEGTFEALCTNVCCFTSNESDWTAVRGSVSGNILTIEAQDPSSTADVCWMVVGERKDQHMLDTDWTDENGRVITERLKSEVDSPENQPEA